MSIVFRLCTDSEFQVNERTHQRLNAQEPTQYEWADGSDPTTYVKEGGGSAKVTYPDGSVFEGEFDSLTKLKTGKGR